MADATKEILKKEAGTPEGVERTRTRKVYTPAVDIIEKKGEIVVIADMPGVDKADVDITLDKNILTIYGRIEDRTPDNLKLKMSEYGYGDYQRAFTLSDEVDRNRIAATVKNGVLTLVLPKAEASTKKIQVIAGA